LCQLMLFMRTIFNYYHISWTTGCFYIVHTPTIVGEVISTEPIDAFLTPYIVVFSVIISQISRNRYVWPSYTESIFRMEVSWSEMSCIYIFENEHINRSVPCIIVMIKCTE
jgi:hypothetical protein